MTMTARTLASRGDRDGLRVVAGREGDDAARALLIRERENLVGRAAHLEGAGALEVLALEEDAAARQPVEGARGDDGRAVDEGADARLGQADEVECQHKFNGHGRARRLRQQLLPDAADVNPP